MSIKYVFDRGLQDLAEEISILIFPHIHVSRIKCFRSYGSSTKRTVARCHAMGKLMQLTVGVEAHYALEFLSEKFDKMPEEEKVKVVIHELMHIPKTFGGGFRYHDHVTDRNVDKMYREYMKVKNETKKDYFKI